MMTQACAVSIMNACLHELVWLLRVSYGGWQAQRSSSGARAMSLEAAVCSSVIGKHAPVLDVDLLYLLLCSALVD